MTLRWLIIEDSEDDAHLLVEQLRAAGYAVEPKVVCGEANVRAALDLQKWDLITSDYAMPGFDGMRALAIVRERGLDTPFILVSGNIGEERAIEALLRGATDYILKHNPRRLPAVVGRALRETRERRQRADAERALEAAQERLHCLLASSPAVIYNLRLEQGRFLPSWVSENITRMTGFTPAEALVPEWFALHLHPEDRVRVLAELDHLPEVGELAQEYRLLTKSGQPIWIRDEMRYLQVVKAEPAGVVGSWTDITDRKAIEEQLRHAQKMEAIGRLAGGIAHDFNNFLTVIQMHSCLLLEEPGLPVDARDAVEQVSLAGERAANLTRQLLTFSRKQVARMRPVDLNVIVVSIARMLQRLLGEDLMLKVNLASDPSRVEADTGMIEQVLMNLAVNARDAMPRGGRLDITTHLVTLDESYLHLHPQARPGRFVCLSVEDTGCGISPEHQAHLFEPFFTTKPVGQGTGLGLATVYGIVELHRGWITVHSEPGSGACFRIYLPPADASASGDGAIAETVVTRGGNETVLLVEDEQQLRTLVRCVLESYGYRVHEAKSGPDALRVWTECRDHVAVLLTDLIMPEGMSGIELAERLRADRPALKVICTSGYSSELVEHALNLPESVHFLQKPFHPQQLATLVRQALDQRSVISDSSGPAKSTNGPRRSGK